MPEQPNDDGLVPPVKVLRKRLNGVYRADGLAGPTRRYVLIVALLVGLASVPTLAVITAGSKEIDDGSTGALDAPFLPLPSTGAVIPVLPDPNSTLGPAAPSSPLATRRPNGVAGDRKTRPRPSKSDRKAVVLHSDDSKYGHRSFSSPSGGDRREHATSSSSRGGSSASPSHWHPKPSYSPPKPSGSGSSTARPSKLGSSSGHGVTVRPPQEPSRPTDPEDEPSAPSEPPFCHGRDRCESWEDRHDRPNFWRHRQCDNSHHRSSDRSDLSRRSTVTERPQNVRSAGTQADSTERTHNSRRHEIESRWEESQSLTRSYRGSHRAERLHRAEDSHSAADDRNSRVGRHHTDQQRTDHSHRW